MQGLQTLPLNQASWNNSSQPSQQQSINYAQAEGIVDQNGNLTEAAIPYSKIQLNEYAVQLEDMALQYKQAAEHYQGEAVKFHGLASELLPMAQEGQQLRELVTDKQGIIDLVKVMMGHPDSPYYTPLPGEPGFVDPNQQYMQQAPGDYSMGMPSIDSRYSFGPNVAGNPMFAPQQPQAPVMTGQQYQQPQQPVYQQQPSHPQMPTPGAPINTGVVLDSFGRTMDMNPAMAHRILDTIPQALQQLVLFRE
jgi:hypothetical protein